jgi:general secretion pathway protein H
MPVTSETGRSRPRGFSLLELMVVLVILGLLAAALPLALGRTMAATRVRATAAALGSRLRDLSSMSVSTGQVLTADFAADRLLTSAKVVKARWDARVEVRAQDVGGKRIARVTFYPDGSVTAAHIKVREDGYAVWIVIQPWSGRIRISNAGA